MKELIKYLILIASTISSLLVASCTPAGSSSSGGTPPASGGTSSAPSDPVDGVQYSYFLRLPMSMNYEADDNGLHINVFSVRVGRFQPQTAALNQPPRVGKE